MLHVESIPWAPAAAHFPGLADEPFLAWLDSVATGDPRGRYSYLCADPFQVLAVDEAGVTLDGTLVPGDAFSILAGQLARFPLPAGSSPVPFAGGAVGFFGYELGGLLERLPRRHGASPLPDMVMGFYDVVLAYDAWEQRAWILSSGFPETEPDARHARAQARAAALRARLSAPQQPRPQPAIASIRWQTDLTPAEYQARVGQVQDYIRAGDIFQANFTMAHRAPRPAGLHPADLYLALRGLSPAPFATYLACGPDLALASASPERFLKLDPTGQVETRPIKGTRPRYADPVADRAAAAALLASEKDRAENLMIVDLMRNDLGRVARIGGVAVPELFTVESFASVHHLVSAVTAHLRPGVSAVDLLRATFPGGSVTGAPKIRAMEIIDALEASRRGPYCGAIAWLGFDGAMDSSIIIRTLVVTGDEIIAQAGGGIVSDSDPAAEFEEHCVKVRPLLQALESLAS
jgi:para-aminobenzoate synthetase component 1